MLIDGMTIFSLGADKLPDAQLPVNHSLKAKRFQLGEESLSNEGGAREPLARRQFPRRDEASGSAGDVWLIGVLVDYGTANPGHG